MSGGPAAPTVNRSNRRPGWRSDGVREGEWGTEPLMDCSHYRWIPHREPENWCASIQTNDPIGRYEEPDIASIECNARARRLHVCTAGSQLVHRGHRPRENEAGLERPGERPLCRPALKG